MKNVIGLFLLGIGFKIVARGMNLITDVRTQRVVLQKLKELAVAANHGWYIDG